MVAECFPGVDVGKMDFDKRCFHRGQRVAQCDRSMGEGGGINNNEIGGLLEQAVKFCDQIALGIALAGF